MYFLLFVQNTCTCVIKYTPVSDLSLSRNLAWLMPSVTTLHLKPPTSTSCVVTSSTCWTAPVRWAGEGAVEDELESFRQTTSNRCTTDTISNHRPSLSWLYHWNVSVRLQWSRFHPMSELVLKWLLNYSISPSTENSVNQYFFLEIQQAYTLFSAKKLRDFCFLLNLSQCCFYWFEIGGAKLEKMMSHAAVHQFSDIWIGILWQFVWSLSKV